MNSKAISGVPQSAGDEDGFSGMTIFRLFKRQPWARSGVPGVRGSCD